MPGFQIQAKRKLEARDPREGGGGASSLSCLRALLASLFTISAHYYLAARDTRSVLRELPLNDGENGSSS